MLGPERAWGLSQGLGLGVRNIGATQGFTLKSKQNQESQGQRSGTLCHAVPAVGRAVGIMAWWHDAKPWLSHPSSNKEEPVPLTEGVILLVPRLSEPGASCQLQPLQCLEGLECARCRTVVPERKVRICESRKWLGNSGKT